MDNSGSSQQARSQGHDQGQASPYPQAYPFQHQPVSAYRPYPAPVTGIAYQPPYIGSQFAAQPVPAATAYNPTLVGSQFQAAAPAISPDVSWIHEKTKYKTAYLQVPMIVERPVITRKKVIVDAHEKVWETKWLQFQVPVQVLEEAKVLVTETVFEDVVTEEEREIKVPHRVMETKTVMVPKQRVVMYEEEQSIEVQATEEVLQQVPVSRQVSATAAAPAYHTTVLPIHSQAQPQYHTIATPLYSQQPSFVVGGGGPAAAGQFSYPFAGSVAGGGIYRPN